MTSPRRQPRRPVRTSAAAVVLVMAGLSVSPVRAAPPTRETRPVLALMSVRAGAGFSRDEVSSVEEVLLSAVEATGRFRVIGRTDLETLLDLETKRQAAGCDDDNVCMTAIAGALGADYIASAGVGRLGKASVLTFKVIDARRVSVLVHAKQTVKDDSDLVGAADEIAKLVVAALPPASPGLRPQEASPSLSPAALRPAPARAMSTGRSTGVAAAAVGAAALVTALVLGVTVRSDTANAQTQTPTSSIPTQIASINRRALGADALLGIGGALAAAGVGLIVAF